MERHQATALLLTCLLATACSEASDDAESSPSWFYWKAEAANEWGDYRAAVNHSAEGWLGERASRSPVSIIYELYDGDRINMALWTADDALEPSCRTIGCYIYAKGEDEKWITLRLLPAETGVLYIGTPWGLREIIEGSSTLYLEVPIRGERGCIFSFDVRGYSRQLHEDARLEATNGLGKEINMSARGGEEEAEDQYAPNWVTWPNCDS